MIHNLKYFQMLNNGTLRFYGVFCLLSDLLFVIRYWLAFTLLPEIYKQPIKDFNFLQQVAIFEEQEKANRELRSRKNIKIIHSKKKRKD